MRTPVVATAAACAHACAALSFTRQPTEDAAFVVHPNTDAFLALGIPQAKHKDLLLALSVNAVQRTHHWLVHYKHLCRGTAPASAPAAGVG
jgi:hypothetical protein